jgi:hypothetical protein
VKYVAIKDALMQPTISMNVPTVMNLVKKAVLGKTTNYLKVNNVS